MINKNKPAMRFAGRRSIASCKSLALAMVLVAPFTALTAPFAAADAPISREVCPEKAGTIRGIFSTWVSFGFYADYCFYGGNFSFIGEGSHASSFTIRAMDGDTATPMSFIRVEQGKIVTLTGEIGGAGDLTLVGGQVNLAQTTSSFVGEFTLERGRVHLMSSVNQAVVFGDANRGPGEQAVFVISGERDTISGEPDAILQGWGTLNADVFNAGAISLKDDVTGQILTVDGNYTSRGGKLRFDAKLTGDQGLSSVDGLRILGDTFSEGVDVVYINDLHLGEPTGTEKIRVIEVLGASHAQFALSGRIAKGAYEYSLRRDENEGSWYLMSAKELRPETGAYQVSTSRIFDFSRAQRVQQDSLRYTQGASWVNVRGHSGRSQQGVETHFNQQALEFGLNAFAYEDGDVGQLTFGLYGGVGQRNAKSVVTRSGYSAHLDTSAQAVGLYGSWRAPAASDGGHWYVDGFLGYEKSRHSLYATDYGRSKFTLNTVEASFELGRSYVVEVGADSSLAITPQGQLLWRTTRDGRFVDASGAQVEIGGTAIEARLGMELDYRFSPKNSDAQLHLFMVADHLRRLKSPRISIDRVALEDYASTRNRIGLGVKRYVSEQSHAEFRVDYTVANSQDWKAGAVLSWNYKF